MANVYKASFEYIIIFLRGKVSLSRLKISFSFDFINYIRFPIKFKYLLDIFVVWWW